MRPSCAPLACTPAAPPSCPTLCEPQPLPPARPARRVIYDNLKKTIAYTLAHAVPEVLPLILNLVLNMPLGAYYCGVHILEQQGVWAADEGPGVGAAAVAVPLSGGCLCCSLADLAALCPLQA